MSVYKIVREIFSNEEGQKFCKKLLGNNSTLLHLDDEAEYTAVNAEMLLRFKSYSMQFWLDGDAQGNDSYTVLPPTSRPSAYPPRPTPSGSRSHCSLCQIENTLTTELIVAATAKAACSFQRVYVKGVTEDLMSSFSSLFLQLKQVCHLAKVNFTRTSGSISSARFQIWGGDAWQWLLEPKEDPMAPVVPQSTSIRCSPSPVARKRSWFAKRRWVRIIILAFLFCRFLFPERHSS